MAEDVEFHGDFAQFRSLSRCEACAAGNHKCVMQESDESCMTCAGAGRKCVFIRTISVSGPKALFPWLSLLGQKRGLIRMADLDLAQLVQDKVLSLTALTSVVNRLASHEPALPRHVSPEFSNYESMGAPSRQDTRNLGADSPALAREKSKTFPRIDRPNRSGSLFYQPSIPSPIDITTTKDALRRRHSSSSSDEAQSRAGLDPPARDKIRDELLLNFREQNDQAELDAKNAQVSLWLSTSDDTSTQIFPPSPTRSSRSSGHRRSISVHSAPSRELRQHINGGPSDQPPWSTALTSPKDNEAERSDSERGHIVDESPPASIGPTDDVVGLLSQEAFPWAEPIRFPGYSSAPGQPRTSNAAMVRFTSRADDVETASQAASWGTDARRRSIEDLDRIIGPSGFLSRFNTSDNQVAMQVNLASEKLVSIFTQSSRKIVSRNPSTPNYNKSDKSKDLPYARPSPQRRKDDLASPTVRPRGIMPAIQPAPLAPRRASTFKAVGEDEDIDSDCVGNDATLLVNFTPWKGSIVPTLDGFKINVREVNPHVAAYLMDRVGQEQLRRYKNLLLARVTHARAKHLRTCPSGHHCTDQGGTPTYLPTKAMPKSPGLSVKAFQNSPGLPDTATSLANHADPDEDPNSAGDDAVMASQLPSGCPLPPSRSLPAQFECPFCFQVRTFHKPSDWSKHVHEDLQPFTCTFPTCPDPKSFKRKADWIRHENERHRQLERWACTENGCAHVCFRRDNFVQHLVREHKYPEPRAKASKSKRSVRGVEKTRASDEGSSQDKIVCMVDSCKVETTKTPAEEPCRFCGSVCATWKKLSVHLAKHMEQVSTPVLELVRQKDITPDMVVVPNERVGGLG